MASVTFKEPYPPSLNAGPSARGRGAAAAAAAGAFVGQPQAPSLKQRRVSLAVPSSARLVPAWSFRDDTSVEKHVAEGALGSGAESGGGKGKARAADEGSPDDGLGEGSKEREKKARRKWTAEETTALIEGCQTVSPRLYNPPPVQLYLI
jgi:hypothetical protein